MSKSVPGILKKLQYTPSSLHQHLPHKHTPIQYRKKNNQQIAPTNTATLLLKDQINNIQSIMVYFLYYA